MLFASIISAHACACASRDASVTTAGRSANQRYMLNRRSAFARPSAEMSPTVQLATLPVHVPSARLARSLFHRAQVSAAVRPAPLLVPPVPVAPAAPVALVPAAPVVPPVPPPPVPAPPVPVSPPGSLDAHDSVTATKAAAAMIARVDLPT